MSKQAYEARHVRGTILGTLREYYPNGLSGQSVYTTIVRPVFPAMEWEDAQQHLLYLQERGYIEPGGQTAIRGQGSPRQRIYRLTATGYDVALGVTEDPAIEAEV